MQFRLLVTKVVRSQSRGLRRAGKMELARPRAELIGVSFV
jgi:hypothetical protein